MRIIVTTSNMLPRVRFNMVQKGEKNGISKHTKKGPPQTEQRLRLLSLKEEFMIGF